MLSDINDNIRASLLYDFLRALLTEKQRSVMALYHEENLSLSEIADEYGISSKPYNAAQAKQKLYEDHSNSGTIDKLTTANAAKPSRES